MYLAFAQSALSSQFAYRWQVWTSIFGQLVQVFARIAIWMSLIAAGSTVAGVSLDDMVTYAVIAGTVLAAWDPSRMLYGVSAALRNGDIASQLLKPVPYPAYLFATELGNLAYRLIAVVVPVVVIAALAYGIKLPATPFHGVAFVGFWMLSFLLLFEISCLSALAAFWLMTAFSIDWLVWALLSLLSGNLIPLWFFPDWLAAAVKYLPFPYVGFYPAAVYLGKFSETETMVLFAVGLGWVALLGLGMWLLWRRATLRITVQGG